MFADEQQSRGRSGTHAMGRHYGRGALRSRPHDGRSEERLAHQGTPFRDRHRRRPCPVGTAEEEGEEEARSLAHRAYYPFIVKLQLSTVALAIVFTASLSAQQRVDVWMHSTDPPDYMKGLNDSMRDGIAVAEHARQAEIQQGWLDLARQQQRQQREMDQRSAQLRDRVLDQNFGYRESRSGVADWKLNKEVMDAFAAARLAHPDFDALLPTMRIIADALQPRWAAITMTEYVECLYAVAKNATFAAQARAALLK
jgi:hypothetical protein